MGRQMLYILCVIGSILVTIDEIYWLVCGLGDLFFPDAADQTPVAYKVLRSVMHLFVLAGWGYITYQVATRKYKWLK